MRRGNDPPKESKQGANPKHRGKRGPPPKVQKYVGPHICDDFRPSPEWQRQGEEVRRAKVMEGIEGSCLKELAKRHKLKEKMRMLHEVVELFKTDWPKAAKV